MAVIVGSILLAFAIDAGWDARVEARDEAVILGALHSEMESTVERIDAHFERRSSFSEALTTFLEAQPPAVLALPSDSAAVLMRSLTFFAAFTVSGDRVRSANVAALDDIELKIRLADWLAEAENVAEDAPFLTTGALELAELSGLVGGPRAMSQFAFPGVPQPNEGLSLLREEGRFIDALLIFDGRERNNLRKIRELRRRTVLVLERLGSEQP